MMSTNRNKVKNKDIQVLRGILCLMIVFFHYFYRYGQLFDIEGTNVFSTNLVVGSFGEFGVLCFFIISGLYARPKKTSSNTDKFVFWIRKIASVYFVYLAAIVLIFMVSFFGGYGIGRTASFSDCLQNIFFVNQVTGATSVDGAHWYVFYLFIILTWLFALNLINRESDYKALIILICINFLVFLGSNFISGILGTIMNVLFKLLGLKYLGMLLIGYLWYLFESSNKKRYLALLCLDVLLIMIEAISENGFYIVMLPIAVIVVAMFYFNIIPLLGKIRVLELIGDASLAIYLIHQNIGYFLITLIQKKTGYYLGAIIVLLIMIMCGLLFNQLIEIPIKKSSKKINIHTNRT